MHCSVSAVGFSSGHIRASAALRSVYRKHSFVAGQTAMRLVAQGEDDTRAAVSLRKAILRLFIYLNFILYEKMVYMVLTDGGSVRRFRLL